MIELHGKVCLVTGGSRGIGAATVEALGRAGGRVVIHCHARRDLAEALAAKLGPERARVVQADLRDPNGPTALWRDALAAFGHVDVLVNNAAMIGPAHLELPLAEWHARWDEVLRVNLVAVADLCREAILHFTPRRSGVIVNVSSRAAFRGDSLEYMHYASSKAGVIALTRSIARGCAKDGIVAYAIAPGFVETDMIDGFVRDYGREAITKDIPLGEMAPPSDVANVVAFLCSGLAKHATGTTIDVNGASYVR
jgi:NAD(P)-dependent dehydrogenase (short-subunit alcohol dehydrogenase family)